ncbi:MAG TPA: hypothetical protein VIL28_13885 [Steroidobacteraceae bacterium]
MNEAHDPLDRLLAELPRSVEPSRDLWRDIEAEIAADRPQRSAPLYTQRWFQLAAAVALVVTSSVITFLVARSSMQEQIARARQEVAEQLQPVLPTMPVRFNGLEIGKSYEEARAELDAEYAKHIQRLPPVVRAKVERDIAELRRSAREISATLAQYPGDPLLQDLLVSTYQREMQVLSEVNSMAATTAAGTDL